MGNKVFMVDGTEGRLYFDIVSKYVHPPDLDVEFSLDRGVTKVGQKPYNLIIVSRAAGKADLYDMADAIKTSRVNKKAEIIILEENPTASAKFVGSLRGRRVYSLKSGDLDKFANLIERMLG